MSTDVVGAILDEIALEGLDGITLPTLWMRLKRRPQFILNTDEDKVRKYIWTVLSSPQRIGSLIQVFKLPKERPDVVYFNRFEHFNADAGWYVEQDEIPDDLYPINPVKDDELQGSCSHFTSRVEVSGDVKENGPSLDDVMKKYGRKLVIVANQTLRKEALGINIIDPNYPLSDVVYCMLEKIGRARELGFVTIGKESAGLDAKRMFYQRKELIRAGFVQKSAHFVVDKRSQRPMKGFVLYLARFYQRRASPLEHAAVKISQDLLERENQECDCVTIRKTLCLNKNMLRNVFSNYDKHFQLFVKDVPKAEVDDEDDEEENEPKNVLRAGKRKFVRLIKPFELEDDDNDAEDQAMKEEDDNEECDADDSDAQQLAVSARIYQPQLLLADRTLLCQVLMLIEACDTSDGLTAMEIGERLHLRRLDVRVMLKSLEKLGLVKTHNVATGRQKVTKYIPLSKVDENDKLYAKTAQGLKLDKSETILNLERSKLIIDYITQAKVVSYTELRKIIIDAEKDSAHLIDKKTIKRLVEKLEKARQLNVFKTHFDAQGKRHELALICVPNLKPDSDVVNEKKQQWMFKLEIGTAEDKPKKVTRRLIKKETEDSVDGDTTGVEELEYQPNVGKKYGVEPKMRKMLTLYSFLHHLLHVKPDERKDVEYNDWRKYVPAIGGQTGYTCTLGEIVPRIPLKIFVKVVFLTYVVPGLDEYLEDEDKCLHTMAMLPQELRKNLMFRRKFMISLQECLTFLEFLGLGSVEYKELYPKESLKFTLKLETELELHGERRRYFFNSLEDINKYIDDLMAHCAVEYCDNCSLDTRLFAHSRRNWTFAPKSGVRDNLDDFDALLSANQATLTLREPSIKYEVVKKKDAPKNHSGQQRKLRRRKHEEGADDSSGAVEPPSVKRIKVFHIEPKPSISTKRVSRKKQQKASKRPAYDSVDKQALQLVKRFRVQWTPVEDNVLLLCRVASQLLDPKSHLTVVVPRFVIRDQLHKLVPSAIDKTGLACQRRLRYMLMDPRTAQNVSEWVAEFRQDPECFNVQRPDVPKTFEKEWTEAFLALFDKVVAKFTNPTPTEPKDLAVSDDTLHTYDITPATTMAQQREKSDVYQEPSNFVGIHVNVVDNVLLSTLLIHYHDDIPSSSFSYALFKIYQRYPDTLVRSVVAKLQKNSVMAKVKSKNVNAMRSQGVTPFKISQHYVYHVQTRWHMKDLIVPLDKVSTISDNDERHVAALMTALIASDNAKITVTIPDNFAMIDSAKSKSKTLQEVDSRTSSRSLLAFRQHLTSLSSDSTNKNQQDMLVLAKCKVSCEPRREVKLSRDKFDKRLAYMAKQIPKTTRVKMAKSKLLTFIGEKKELGATVGDILAFNNGRWPDKELSKLESEHLVYRVGVKTYRYVHKEHLTPWVVQSVSDKRDCEGNEITLQYVAKLWKKPNGEIEYRTVHAFCASIVAHVMSFPGVSQEDIVTHYRIVMPAVQVTEIIELLVEIDCLQETRLEVEKMQLFAKCTEQPQVKVFYETTADCLIRLSMLKKLLNA